MSVNQSQRGESKLTVLVKAMELTVYTIQICTNDKVFLPKYQTALTNDIIKASKDLYIKARCANDIRIAKDDPHLADAIAARRKAQSSAIADCNSLLAMIDIAQKLYHLSGRRVYYWAGLVMDVRALLRKWRDSDAKRAPKSWP